MLLLTVGHTQFYLHQGTLLNMEIVQCTLYLHCTDNHEEWCKKRLDQKQQLPPNMPAGNLELGRLVQYRIARGLKLQIVRAYGMPGEYREFVLH